ncbi:RNA methyltransferase [Natronospora cellulosivora (SeqCode)]
MGRLDADVFVGLLHYPIQNKKGDVITTTITNLDLHDISRACKSYDINKYFVINPIESQKSLAQRMKEYWTSEYGAKYNPNRNEAFSVLEICNDLEESVKTIKDITGKEPVLIATDARPYPNTISYKKLRKLIIENERPIYLIFGTGWGIIEEEMRSYDYILEPIWGRGDFNHLSVRSAASIIMDRLLSEEWWV